MISIIIPVYNQSKQLDLCLDAISNQTFTNYEIIVVNDRSTQKMSLLMAKYRKVFGINITFLHNSINHGAPYSRNKGFKKSRGEFIIFCDADVVMKAKCLEKMYHALKEREEVSFVYSSFRYGNKKFKCFPFDKELLKQMPYIHSTSLIRRAHFPASGWDQALERLQDWDLFLTMVKWGHEGYWIDEVLFTSIGGGGTMSSWLPKLSYKLLPFLPAVKRYKDAVAIVKKKHGIK